MIFLTILTLYTSRVVLAELGVEDYGLYNVIGGIVTMLGFFNSAMSSATQRYMAMDIGRGDFVQLRKTFNASLMIYLLIGAVAIIIFETIGLWYVNNKLSFPADKSFSVNVVYQFTILTFLLNLTQLPYNALILAREKMQIFTVITLLDTLLKLGILYLLFLSENKIVLYSILIFITTIIVQLTYQLYCQRYFKETKLYLVKDRTYLKELLSFSGWNLFGNIAAVARSQGLNLMLNASFGFTLNAAYSISNQVQIALSTFVANFQKAINPQIIKQYGKGDTAQSELLTFLGAKYSYFLILLISIPLFLYADSVLDIWLNTVPDYTVIFVRICILVVVVDSISGTLMTLCQATGRIKWYQIIVGTLVFLNLPISFLLIEMGGNPQVTYWTMLVISVFSLFFRIFFLKKIANISVLVFFKEVLLKIMIVTLVIASFLFAFKSFFFKWEGYYLGGILRVLIIWGVCIVSIAIFGLSKDEKLKIVKFIRPNKKSKVVC